MLYNLLLVMAPSSAAPPAFAEEFSLEYTVSNLQYGFVVQGKWSVDHRNATTTNLRERTDTYNKTLQPRVEVKDFLHGKDWSFSDAPPAPRCACGPTNGTQPRWALPADATILAPSSAPPATQRWRVFHADISVCVDFFIGVDTATGMLAQLPSTLLYLGNCTSGTVADPAAEVLAQNNSYYSFVLEPQSDALFQPQGTCDHTDPCVPSTHVPWRTTMHMDNFGTPH